MDTIAKPQERHESFIDPVAALNAPEIQELAQLAVTKFRERSRHYETECLMPEENLKELFDRGWLTASLSKKFGGKGTNLETDDPATYLQAIRVVARGCGSTAHCMQLNNHTNWMLEAIATEDQKERFLKPQFKKPLLVT
ncbi:MAG: acyl-CoA dehydrogenase family protein, partial [Reyranellaceae bacterium]